jgi:regulator of replication initiation timing
VASRVLENGTLELEEYRLRLKEKLPELILPKDRKKLYVENIDSNTTTDSLTNYFEVKTGVEVCGIQDGSNRDALITFDGEPGTTH